MNPAWIAAICALVTVVFAVLGWAGRRSWNFFKRVWQFLEDWNGTPADNRGHQGQPGVMERLSVLENQVHLNSASMAGISEQVHLNSGHSLKDVVTRTEAAVGALTASVNELKAR